MELKSTQKLLLGVEVVRNLRAVSFAAPQVTCREFLSAIQLSVDNFRTQESTDFHGLGYTRSEIAVSEGITQR